MHIYNQLELKNYFKQAKNYNIQPIFIKIFIKTSLRMVIFKIKVI